MTCLVAGLGGWYGWPGAARPAPSATWSPPAPTSRPAVVETVQVAAELRMWQARRDRAADAVAATSDRIGHDRPRGRELVGRRARPGPRGDRRRGGGGGAVASAAAVAGGELSGPMLALLVLMPLALAEVAAPLSDAGALVGAHPAPPRTGWHASSARRPRSATRSRPARPRRR